MATTTKRSSSKSAAKSTTSSRSKARTSAAKSALPPKSATKDALPERSLSAPLHEAGLTAPAVAMPLDGGATEDEPVGATAQVLKKKQLVDEVVARCGVKKRDAKPAIEAALAILGEALMDGQEMNLPPLGKLKVKRTKRVANARVMMVHVRRNDIVETDDKDPLAQAAEER